MKSYSSARRCLLFIVTVCLMINGMMMPFFWLERTLVGSEPPQRLDEDPRTHHEVQIGFEIFDTVVDKKNLFANYDPSNPPLFKLQNDTRKYLKKVRDLSCMIEGTNWTSMALNDSVCQCIDDWFGPHCSWPFLLKFSEFDDYEELKLRESPRRVINVMSFNIELDILEMRLEEMSVADAFMITESNFTGHGDPKPMFLLNALKNGRYLQNHHKIIHVFQDYFPPAARKNGWLADYLPRDVIGSKGIRNGTSGIRPDDILILTDADEIITKEVLLFLKLHDGYSEPVCMNLHKTNYGFFWRVGNGDWIMCGAATFGFVDKVMNNKVSWMRYPMEHVTGNTSVQLQDYIRSGAYVTKWEICPPGVYCGWHCSWCFHIEGIQKKLLSAINADFPRWGDYPEKTKLEYIRDLVRDGKWFNEKENFSPVAPSFYMYAPAFVVENPDKFRYLLQNPYRNMTKQINATVF